MVSITISEKKTYRVIVNFMDEGDNEVIKIVNDVTSKYPCDYCAIRKDGGIDLFDRTEFYVNDKFEFVGLDSENCEMVWYQLEEVI